MLRTARIVHREKIGVGVAGAEKCLLEIDGLQFHAVFRSIDVMLRQGTRTGAAKPTMKYRDAAIFEAAAYEISDLLGLGRVPPVVERVVESQRGTLQIWMEDTQPEIDLAQRKELNPPDWVRWNQQKAIMFVFDNLIANSDRNKGNLLIDRNWRIWFIDHTRAFKRSSRLLYRDQVTSCERQLWKALRETDKKEFCMRLKPYLDRPEISYIQTRRRKLIRHIEGLIAKHGEEAVIFDLRPPTNPLNRENEIGRIPVF